MTDTLNDEAWVWVFVQNPEGAAQIIGQKESDSGVAFIPVFYSKETALQCFNLLAIDPGVKTEAQAIIFEDLKQYARDGGFMIFMLDGRGGVKEKIGV